MEKYLCPWHPDTPEWWFYMSAIIAVVALAIPMCILIYEF